MLEDHDDIRDAVDMESDIPAAAEASTDDAGFYEELDTTEVPDDSAAYEQSKDDLSDL